MAQPRLGMFHSLRLNFFLFLYDPDGGVIKGLYDRWYGPLNDRIYKYITEHAQKGNPDSVIHAFNRFSREQQWTFCLGDDKGPIVRKIVEDVNPITCLELGTFVGYSAINAARVLPQGARYVCIEPDVSRIQTAKKIIEFAGLQDKIQILQGYSTEVIPTLKDQLSIEKFDFIFMDHVKDLYKSDLLLLEKHGLLQTGSVLAADNVITPGSPEYLEYVRTSPKYESEFFESYLEYTGLVDGVEKSTYLG